MLMFEVVKGWIDLFVPHSCFGCGSPSQRGLCQSCLDSLIFIQAPLCQKCGYPTLNQVNSCRQCRDKKLYYDQARSLLSYEGKVKELLLTLKSTGSFALADRLIDMALKNISADLSSIQAVTYIPTTITKRVKRGHNISEIIAKCFSHRLNLPVVETLKLNQNVNDQASLDINQRQENMRSAFKMARLNPNYLTLLLVDDIYTTGATTNEACRILSKADYSINVFTIARTL